MTAYGDVILEDSVENWRILDPVFCIGLPTLACFEIGLEESIRRRPAPRWSKRKDDFILSQNLVALNKVDVATVYESLCSEKKIYYYLKNEKTHQARNE